MVPGAEYNSQHWSALPLRKHISLAVLTSTSHSCLIPSFKSTAQLPGPGPLQPHTFPPAQSSPGAAVEPCLLPVTSPGPVEF